MKPRYRHRTFQGAHVCKPFWEYAHAVGPAGVGMAKKCLQMMQWNEMMYELDSILNVIVLLHIIIIYTYYYLILLTMCLYV